MKNFTFCRFVICLVAITSLLSSCKKENEEPYDPTNVDERSALVALYKAIEGDHWQPFYSNWCTNKPIDQWRGIKTNEQGYVVEITLS